MIYRETGQFKTTYASDQQLFPILQDRVFVIALIIFAFVGVPLLGTEYLFLAILIPFTYHLDAHSAFALLLGMAAVNTSSDLIPAVLFGVPGTVGAAATVIYGHQMARRGEAGRAAPARGPSRAAGLRPVQCRDGPEGP